MGVDFTAMNTSSQGAKPAQVHKRVRFADDEDEIGTHFHVDLAAHNLSDDFRHRADAVFGPLGEAFDLRTSHTRAAAVADINEEAEAEFDRLAPLDTLRSPLDDLSLREAIEEEDAEEYHNNNSGDSESDEDDNFSNNKSSQRDARVPGYTLHPERWTKYSLEDVSTDVETEKASALSFLRTLRERREANSKKPDENSQSETIVANEAVIGRKPVFNNRRGGRGPTNHVAAWRAYIEEEDNSNKTQQISNDSDEDSMQTDN